MIAVPEDIESWPPALRRVTLLHELGHIERRDAWTDYVGQGVACLLWPVPLTWVAVAYARRLRERACDEWSLERYHDGAKSYALNLVEAVRRCQQAGPSLASGMADRRDLESRLRWLFASPGDSSTQRLLRTPVALVTIGLAVAIATAGPAALAPQANAEASTDTTPVAVTREPSSGVPAVSVSGTVRDSAGNPLIGAEVVLRANLGGVQYVTGLQHARDVLARTRTDAEGRYRFSAIGMPPRLVDQIGQLDAGEPGAQVLAWADGAALRWQPVESFEKERVDFQLPVEAEVSGVIRDEEGRLVEEGELSVIGFSKATESGSAFLDDPGDLNLMRSLVQFTAKVRDGSFRMANLPADYRVSARLRSTRGHRKFLVIDTGDGEFDEITYRNAGQRSTPVHRNPITLTAEQQPFVRIKVVNDQGDPVSGGVEAVDSKRHYGGSAAVGDDGTAVLIVNSAGKHDVYYASDPLEPRIGVMQSIDIAPTAGGAVEIRLPATHSLTGKVVDADTGEPVAGVYVYAGLLKKNDSSKPRVNGAMAISNREGRFAIPVVPGKHKLSIRHDVHGYLAPTYTISRETDLKPEFPTITVTEEGPTEEVVIKIARGLVVKGRVVDQEGTPIAEASVTASCEGIPYKSVKATTNAQGHFIASGLSPYVPVRLAVISKRGAAEYVVAPSENHPWNETLTKNVDLQLATATSVVGRILRAGLPAAGVRVTLQRAGPSNQGDDWVRYSPHDEAVTDQQGGYRLTGLRKGDKYQIEVEPQEGAEVRDWRYQSPYSHTVDVDDGQTIELPDAKLMSNGQRLAGVVVDAEGNPVEGITVSAKLASGMHLSRPRNGSPPWTETDASGRFKLTHLPDEPIALMAYKANPAGGRILHPSHASPEMNARDIQIVFDPSLVEPPEDLD